MQTGDGQLARLRVADRRLSPHQFIEIAELAERHGNGLVEITARGNLQVRGLRSETVNLFADAADTLLPIETGLVIETPPLAGDDPSEITDPRPLAAAIRSASRHLADRLAPKLTVIVDGAGQLQLGHLKADIRLVAVAGDRWHLTVGNSSLGAGPANTVQHLAAALLSRIAELGSQARATDLPGYLLQELGTGLSQEPALPAHVASKPIGTFALHTAVAAVGIALPFGAADWRQLAALGELAARCRVSELRLAPGHALLAVGAGDNFARAAATLGFITTPLDPRLNISACIGSAGCSSGHFAARALASRLAQTIRPDTDLHISGCTKGCAHPRRAALTLVGRADGYGLVIDGKAGDTPQALLQADQIESAISGALRQG